MAYIGQKLGLKGRWKVRAQACIGRICFGPGNNGECQTIEEFGECPKPLPKPCQAMQSERVKHGYYIERTQA